MADCEFLKGCLFFNDKMSIDEGIGALYKHRYCQGDRIKCARYIISIKLGWEKVPVDLYPNMYERAKRILARDSRENKE